MKNKSFFPSAHAEEKRVFSRALDFLCSLPWQPEQFDAKTQAAFVNSQFSRTGGNHKNAVPMKFSQKYLCHLLDLDKTLISLYGLGNQKY